MIRTLMSNQYRHQRSHNGQNLKFAVQSFRLSVKFVSKSKVSEKILFQKEDCSEIQEESISQSSAARQETVSFDFFAWFIWFLDKEVK